MSALLALLLAACAQDAAEAPAPPDPVGDERAFVEWVATPDRAYEGQPVTLRLRVGVDRDWFAREVLQPFRRPLDLPLSVRARWGEEWADARALPTAAEEGAVTFVLDGEIARGNPAPDVERGGRTFRVVELERRIAPLGSGFLAREAPLGSFSYGTAFREDPFAGRVPTEWSETFVHGAPLLLTVDPLPTAGRPAEFTGAVGRFTLHATASATEVAVGESFAWTLTIEGDGDLARFEPPRLDASADFHVYGVLDDQEGGRRTLVYDLAALHADVRAVPPVSFAAFDPTPPAGYWRWSTDPLPLRVRPGAGVAGPAVAGALVEDVSGLPTFTAGRGVALAPTTLSAWIGLPWLLALIARAWTRARYRDLRDPRRARARKAAARFRRRARGDVERAFAEYLAARLERAPAAAVDERLGALLVGRGVPRALAERAAATLSELVGARYGGRAVAADAGRVRALVEDLEQAFRAGEVR